MKSNKNNRIEKNRNILLIIAHPDDEAMFFSPILNSFPSSCTISLLCLSTGNFEGLGERRKQELLHSAHLYGIRTEDVYVVDHPLLQDSMSISWPISVVSETVLDILKDVEPDLV